jgi:hypothetical protein
MQSANEQRCLRCSHCNTWATQADYDNGVLNEMVCNARERRSKNDRRSGQRRGAESRLYALLEQGS